MKIKKNVEGGKEKLMMKEKEFVMNKLADNDVLIEKNQLGTVR